MIKIVKAEVRELTPEIVEVVTTCSNGHLRFGTRYNNDAAGHKMARNRGDKAIGRPCGTCR